MSATFYNYTIDSSSMEWSPGPTDVAASQTLIIKASGAVQWSSLPRYSLPEGGYGRDGYPATHTLSPGDSSRPNPANPVTNSAGLALAILAVPSGSIPGSLTPGAGRGDALVPRWSVDVDGETRVAAFYSSDMANKTHDSGPWDIFFAFNDGNYTDNSGSFEVTAIVTDVSEQRSSQIISLPGHMTQEDIDSAEFCSFSGLLTPGNRLRDIDGRLIADIFAPYSEDGPEEDY